MMCRRVFLLCYRFSHTYCVIYKTKPTPFLLAFFFLVWNIVNQQFRLFPLVWFNILSTCFMINPFHFIRFLFRHCIADKPNKFNENDCGRTKGVRTIEKENIFFFINDNKKIVVILVFVTFHK